MDHDILHQHLSVMLDHHRTLPVPGRSDADAVGMARAALIRYDSHVAGVVIRALEGFPVEAQWLTPDQELDERLAPLREADPEAVDAMRAYKQRLDAMLALAADVLAARD